MMSTKRGWFVSGMLTCALAMPGCSKDDPFAEDTGADGTGTDTGGTDDSASTSGTSQGSADATSASTTQSDTGMADTGMADTGMADTGSSECPPIPTRMIVLGDSIFACFGVGGKESADCSAKIFHQYVSDNVAPLGYENAAVNGAVTQGVIDNQIPGLSVGMPGHVLVLIFIGGNDLQPYIFMSDEDTMADYAQKRPVLDQNWADIFAFLNDPANFPDGTTIVMNTQYNPFDDCTAAPYQSMTPAKTMLLGEYNADLVAKADSLPNAWIADQHGPYLGHGHHFDKPECPHYIEGAEGWMFDLIHPDTGGHANLATELAAVADGIYTGCE